MSAVSFEFCNLTSPFIFVSILLSSDGIAKLCDFGVSHIFDDTIDKTLNHQRSFGLTRQDTDNALQMKPMAHDGLMTKTEGTYAFWSPEMCQGGRAFSGYAADLWAAGVCLYIFVTGRLPFYSESPAELMDVIKDGIVPYDENMSDNLADLLRMVLIKDPEKRAGVGDCLKHPFLLLARAQRIKQLNVEFEKSKSTNTIVEESDIRHVSFTGGLFCSQKIVVVAALISYQPYSLCGTGVSHRYILTGRAASISVEGLAGRLQSSKAPIIFRWKIILGSRGIEK